MPDRDIYLYGSELNEAKAANLTNIHFMGLVDDHEIIANHKGDFGISWYGLSLDDGIGKVGEYMAYNNPHKVGLYLRCNAPVIVWSRAGRAGFILDEDVGLAVNSLRELNHLLKTLPAEKYRKMTDNVMRVNSLLKSGYYLRKALIKALRYLGYTPEDISKIDKNGNDY